jgi:hypothetical protein
MPGGPQGADRGEVATLVGEESHWGLLSAEGENGFVSDRVRRVREGCPYIADCQPGMRVQEILD